MSKQLFYLIYLLMIFIFIFLTGCLKEETKGTKETVFLLTKPIVNIQTPISVNANSTFCITFSGLGIEENKSRKVTGFDIVVGYDNKEISLEDETQIKKAVKVLGKFKKAQTVVTRNNNNNDIGITVVYIDKMEALDEDFLTIGFISKNKNSVIKIKSINFCTVEGNEGYFLNQETINKEILIN